MVLQSKFNVFYDELLRIYKISCPLRSKSLLIVSVTKPWITDAIKIKIKRKHYLFRRYTVGAIPFSTYNNHKLETRSGALVESLN